MSEESFYLLKYKNPNRPQFGAERRYGNKPSGTIVIHTAENVADRVGSDLGAENVAAYIARRTDYGSYHRLVDSDSIIKMAPFGYETWHCRVTNPWSIGISMAVMADDWNKYSNDYVSRVVRNAARAAAEAVLDLKKHWGITVPLRRITRAQALSKSPGFIGHGETDPGRRRDPGSEFPWGLFFQMIREELNNEGSPVEAEPVNNPITPVTPKPIPERKGTRYKVNTIDLNNAHKKKVRNSDMKKWQGLLLAHGYGPRGLVNPSSGRPDGIGGLYTRRGTLAFQEKMGIAKDGVVGPITWGKALEG
jgi:peptidoglycan hydrolase-like protein with peptidoglycan-binding domain